MSFPETRDEIFRRKEKNKILIAAHQGTSGGYIVPNTIPAFENALKHGCDIIEVDAVMSTDGDFFAFHDGKEKVILGVDQRYPRHEHQGNCLFSMLQQQRHPDQPKDRPSGRHPGAVQRKMPDQYRPVLVLLERNHPMHRTAPYAGPDHLEISCGPPAFRGAAGT